MNSVEISTYNQSLSYNPYHQNNHMTIQNMKKSSKSVSKYLESSSMLYSPNKRFNADEAMKNNVYVTNTGNSNSGKEEVQKLENMYGERDRNQSNNSKNQQAQNQSRLINQPVYSNSNNPNLNLGRVVSKLQTRIQNTQIKIASLTNIVKLLQKYSQTKDDQYQKQKENILFTKTVGQRVQQIENLQIENKIKEFNVLSKQMKKEIQQVGELRMKMENNLLNSVGSVRENKENDNKGDYGSKKIHSIKSKRSDFMKSPASNGSYIDVQDLAQAFQQMENRLRDQINKKTQICLRQIKKVTSNNSNQVSGVDQNIFEQQINSLNFAINKLQNECNRNKMVLQNQIQEIMSKLSLGYHTGSFDYLPRKYSNLVDPVKNSQRAVRDKSLKKSHSRKKSTQRQRQTSRSKSNLKRSQLSQKNKLQQNIKQKLKLQDRTKAQQKRKIKQQQIKQAIRRKKQTKQKLKSKI